MLFIPFIIGGLLFGIAYIYYGSLLAKKFNLSNDNPTPSHTMTDGVDYVPTKPIVLFGHHFSSIAGAGPIVGPILGAAAFGWLPALFWIIVGSIFIGGVHDFGSIVASIRHKARSIAEIAKEYMGQTSYTIFLIFIWLTLVYVLIVFLDLTASTFAKNGVVASTSILYIILAVIFGVSLYKLRLKLIYGTIIFVSLIFFSIYIGHRVPLNLKSIIIGTQPTAVTVKKIPIEENKSTIGNSQTKKLTATNKNQKNMVSLKNYIQISKKKVWCIFLLLYVFFASTLPVWTLLQPRDYLSSFLLYSSVVVGAIGIIFGGFHINYPAYTNFYIGNKSLFPILFVTIACGAISGFHSLVASGTTSKQLDKETDAKVIGYGGMLMEGIVALIALATIMVISKGAMKAGPIAAYAAGIGKFASVIGIPVKFGTTFGLLVLSAFLLTTLDTATRLARYVLQELFNWQIQKTRFLATLITLILPAIFVFIDIKGPKGQTLPAWKAIWPVFGASNQLLATLVLLVISVWLKKLKKNILITVIPLIFMFAVTLTAIIQLIIVHKLTAVGIIAIVLFAAALFLIGTSYKIILGKK